VTRRPANDPGQYDDLVQEWWKPWGAFAPLHWLAAARAALVPPAATDGAVLLDVACGGGLLAPYVPALGYRHVGVDIGVSAVRTAHEHGIEVVRGDVLRLPVRTESCDVVVAGEIFEHVPDLEGLIAEIARVLAPGGVLVCDTLADTAVCKALLVTVGERVPAVPRGIHDPDLFVDPGRLQDLCAKHGISLRVRGLRPAVLDVFGWLLHLRRDVRMLPIRWTGAVYQGLGSKDVA
jgi:2-polyprenyl-6-hydroxyphenyl methylase/3-demethylubiquinone-9 3-methyltransferase